jgi:hypothetical protein
MDKYTVVLLSEAIHGGKIKFGFNDRDSHIIDKHYDGYRMIVDESGNRFKSDQIIRRTKFKGGYVIESDLWPSVLKLDHTELVEFYKSTELSLLRRMRISGMDI